MRVHTDPQAHQMADALGARAFARGRDIYVAQGEYRPATDAGQHLLAHELTHVVQQGAVGLQRQPAPERRASNEVLRYLQSLRDGTPPAEARYARTIAEFRRSHPGRDIATLQRQLLETTRQVDIRQADASASLRRKGNDDTTPALPQKTVTVNVTNIQGGKARASTAISWSNKHVYASD